MMEKGKMARGVVELVDTESLVPQEHLLRKVDMAVEFRKLYEIVEPLYSEEEGRPSIDPMALFKIVMLQHLDGIPSLRGDAAQGADGHRIPVVFRIHTKRGVAAFLHGEL